MPVLGYTLGILVYSIISSVDHYVALILLTLIGSRMIYEFFKKLSGEREEIKVDISKGKYLVGISIATSIDALAVGVTFPVLKLKLPLIPAILFIGTLTFFMSLSGVYIGRKTRKLIGPLAELAGGLILILLGIKIFLEHTL